MSELTHLYSNDEHDDIPMVISYDYQPYESTNFSPNWGDGYPGCDEGVDITMVTVYGLEIVLPDELRSKLEDICLEREHSCQEAGCE